MRPAESVYIYLKMHGKPWHSDSSRFELSVLPQLHFFPQRDDPFLQLSNTAFFSAQPLSKWAFALVSYGAQSACSSVLKISSISFPPKQFLLTGYQPAFSSAVHAAMVGAALLCSPWSSSRPTNCRLAGRDPPPGSCPVWESSSICCSKLSCNNISQRTKERNFHTY